MKTLITGTAGFIGSNLAKRLKGDKLYGFDNLTTGSVDNLEGVGIEMIQSIETLYGKDIDRIFHLGMPSSSPIYRDDKYKILDALKITLDVLELAKKCRCKVVYASSSSLYNGNKPPFTENVDVKITDFYTEARYYVERMFKLYNDFYGVESVGLRFFSVYGNGEKHKGEYANLISQFRWAMLKGERPVIYGDGSQTRDFTYVEDVIDALLLATESKTDIYNVGTGKAYSLNELVEILNQTLKTDIKPVYIENPMKNYVQETLADTTKAETKLKFKAKHSLGLGILKMV